MSRPLPAVLVVIAALSALAAAAMAAPKSKFKLSRAAGKVLQAVVKVAPGPSGPVLIEGRLTLLDKAERTVEFKATSRTRVTLDGKAATFEKSTAPGALVLKALYNTDTKELAALDLKSAPSAPIADADGSKPADTILGEVANTDIFKGVLSVRSDRQAVRDYAVTDATMIVRKAEDKPAAMIRFEAINVGDAVEVSSRDGKTALEVRVHGRPTGKP